MTTSTLLYYASLSGGCCQYYHYDLPVSTTSLKLISEREAHSECTDPVRASHPDGLPACMQWMGVFPDPGHLRRRVMKPPYLMLIMPVGWKTSAHKITHSCATFKPPLAEVISLALNKLRLFHTEYHIIRYLEISHQLNVSFYLFNYNSH